MRKALIHTLLEIAENDDRVVLLTADLGFSVLEPFAQAFPGRFFNVGVAEQDMIGIATGLAEAGFIPYVYSIGTFASLRPYEFIRNGPILHQLPVRIIGIGAGFDYGSAGITHYNIEDIGIFRLQPGISVISPADADQTRAALLSTRSLKRPVYYRLAKDTRPAVPGLEGQFVLGRADMIRQGDDLLFITTGPIVHEVLEAAALLENKGVKSSVMVVSSFNPAPTDDIRQALMKFSRVITVETHYIVGGLGSCVAEIATDHGINSRIVRCGIKSMPNGLTGSSAYMREMHGLCPKSLLKTALHTAREIELAH